MRRTPWLYLVAGAGLVLAACAHREVAGKDAAVNAPQPYESWTRLVIADGSANLYRFTRGEGEAIAFVYEPVTPEQSSTGQYSGGSPRKETLAAGDARLVELWALLRALEAEETLHTPDRAKGTGAISWVGPGGERAFIIQRGAQLAGLLALLARFGK